MNTIKDKIKHNLEAESLQWKTKNVYVCRQVTAAFASSLMMFSVGATYGISAILIPQLKEDPDFTYEDQYGSWIASIIPLTVIFGSLSAGTVMDMLGRRSCQMLVTIPYLIGWLIMGFASDLQTLLAGRIITGIFAGAIRPFSIVYLGELTNPKYRGNILFSLSMMFNSGVLFCHAISKFVYWKINTWLCGSPLIIAFIILFFMKESPSWLISKGKIEEGIANFKWYRGEAEEAEKELQEILLKETSDTVKFNATELTNLIFSRVFIKPFATVFLLFLLVQYNGANTISFYAQDMLKSTFGNTIDTFILIITTDCVRVLSSILLCGFSESLSHKKILLSCSLLTVLSLLCLVLVLYTNPVAYLWIMVTVLVVYIAATSVICSIPWPFVAVIFPAKLRGIGAGVSMSMSSIILFISVQSTPDLMSLFGIEVIYVAYVITTFVCSVVLYFILPETQGKTLHEIEQSFNIKNRNAKDNFISKL